MKLHAVASLGRRAPRRPSDRPFRVPFGDDGAVTPRLFALLPTGLVLAVLTACSSPAARDTQSPDASTPPSAATPSTSPSHHPPARSDAGDAPAPLPADGFVRHEGAPDPLACAADEECTHGQTWDASGCCGTFRDMAATAQSKAYLKHASDWRAAHCDGHACMSPPVPTEPPACLFDVRCVAQRCRNACR